MIKQSESGLSPTEYATLKTLSQFPYKKITAKLNHPTYTSPSGTHNSYTGETFDNVEVVFQGNVYFRNSTFRFNTSTNTSETFSLPDGLTPISYYVDLGYLYALCSNGQIHKTNNGSSWTLHTTVSMPSITPSDATSTLLVDRPVTSPTMPWYSSLITFSGSTFQFVGDAFFADEKYTTGIDYPDTEMAYAESLGYTKGSGYAYVNATSGTIVLNEIQTYFLSATELYKVSIRSRDWAGDEDASTASLNAPKNIYIQYSFDGSSWTNLASFTNQVNWKPGETRTFSFTPYTSRPPFPPHFRINVTANNGGSKTEIGFIRFYSQNNIVSYSSAGIDVNAHPVLISPSEFVCYKTGSSNFAVGYGNTVSSADYHPSSIIITGPPQFYKKQDGGYRVAFINHNYGAVLNPVVSGTSTTNHAVSYETIHELDFASNAFTGIEFTHAKILNDPFYKIEIRQIYPDQFTVIQSQPIKKQNLFIKNGAVVKESGNGDFNYMLWQENNILYASRSAADKPGLWSQPLALLKETEGFNGFFIRNNLLYFVFETHIKVYESTAYWGAEDVHPNNVLDITGNVIDMSLERGAMSSFSITLEDSTHTIGSTHSILSPEKQTSIDVELGYYLEDGSGNYLTIKPYRDMLIEAYSISRALDDNTVSIAGRDQSLFITDRPSEQTVLFPQKVDFEDDYVGDLALTNAGLDNTSIVKGRFDNLNGCLKAGTKEAIAFCTAGDEFSNFTMTVDVNLPINTAYAGGVIKALTKNHNVTFYALRNTSTSYTFVVKKTRGSEVITLYSANFTGVKGLRLIASVKGQYVYFEVRKISDNSLLHSTSITVPNNIVLYGNSLLLTKEPSAGFVGVIGFDTAEILKLKIVTFDDLQELPNLLAMMLSYADIHSHEISYTDSNGDVEYATIDPGEPIISAINRSIDGRYLKMVMRFNNTIKFWRPLTGSAEKTINSDAFLDGYNKTIDTRDIRTSIRLLGAQHYATYTSADGVGKYGHRFGEVNNPYIMTEADCLIEAKYNYAKMLQNATRIQFSIPADVTLEAEDIIEVDGVKWIIEGITMKVGIELIEQNITARLYVEPEA